MMKPNKDEAQAAFEAWRENKRFLTEKEQVYVSASFKTGFKAGRTITPAMIERVLRYLDEHACHCKIDNSTQYDAFVYHLLKAALGGDDE